MSKNFFGLNRYPWVVSFGLAASLASPAWMPLRASQAANQTASLKEYLQLALEKNELTRINQTQQAQYEAKKDQALAPSLPQLKILGSYAKQDVPPGTKRDDTTSAARVNLAQPILGLYKNYEGLEAARKQLEAIGLSADDAVLQFKLAVNEAFHAALIATGDLASYDEVQKIAAKRVQEISGRVKIGRSKPADLYAAEAQLASADAQLEQARSNLTTALSSLSQVSGVGPEIELSDSLTAPKQTDPLQVYLSKSSEQPAIKALSAQMAAVGAQVSAVRAQRVPDLDLIANYHLRRDPPLKDVKWDVGVQLTWSIYDGGLISGKVSEAAAQRGIYQEQLNQKQRLTDMKIRQQHQALEASIRQIPKLERAVTMGQKNYDAILKDYRLGLATVLDLIQSSNSLADARRQLNRQTLTAKSLWVALKLNAGQTL